METYQSTLDFKRKPENSLDEAVELKNNKEFKKALKLIENIESFEAFRLKAEILTNLKDFKKAIDYFDKALKIKSSDEITLEKADALYKWAKITYFPEGNFEKALDFVNQALEILPESVDASELWFLKGEIYQSLNLHIDARRCFLKAEKRFEELEILESELKEFEIHKSDVLINITGVNFYHGLKPFKKGVTLKLIRDTENEHDPDAIAVMCEDKIVGYVANSEYTLIKDVKSASEIKNNLTDSSTAEVLFVFQNEFVISKVIF